MKNICKKLSIIFSAFFVFFFYAYPVSAAAPDGMGAWADSALFSNQGLMKNGNPVPAIRSNPTSSLGVAENDTVEGHFFSLGFGGSIILGFDNGISSGVIVVEATNPLYPIEKAKLEVSENGTNWLNAGQVAQDGSVNKPTGVGCVKFVRVTDVSNPNDFTDETADGYDLDGVRATGESCQPPTCSNNGCCASTIKQSTNTSISNQVSIVQNTTGNATTNVNILTTANTNIANNENCCGKNSTANVIGKGMEVRGDMKNKSLKNLGKILKR